MKDVEIGAWRHSARALYLSDASVQSGAFILSFSNCNQGRALWIRVGRSGPLENHKVTPGSGVTDRSLQYSAGETLPHSFQLR
jgi:hypothetical protein